MKKSSSTSAMPITETFSYTSRATARRRMPSMIEGIRGKAVAREVYERVSVVGIALVLFLFVIGISNDVGKLGGG